MRSTAHILNIISRLLKVWMAYPELSLCQLIHTVFKGDLYYIEDERLLTKLEQHYKERGD